MRENRHQIVEWEFWSEHYIMIMHYTLLACKYRKMTSKAVLELGEFSRYIMPQLKSLVPTT
jgi:hypothetical protein